MSNDEILKMNNGKKFDIVLMNPPFSRDLHLKFLEKAIKIADNVVSVQPVRWLEDPISKFNKKSEQNKYFPYLDFSKVWTDEELFKMIGMEYNKEEIDIIEKEIINTI